MAIHYYPPSQNPDGALPLLRRGFDYGWIKADGIPPVPPTATIKTAWQGNEAIFLPGILRETLAEFQTDIAQAHKLMAQVLAGEDLSNLLEDEPYAERLEADFALSGASLEDNDPQAIEKVIFDAWQEDDIVADNLWCKASWLSFIDEDDSLRFRFSFGFEGYEDVAADQERQRWAAKLTDAIFPESAIVTRHEALNRLLAEMLDCGQVEFAERIIYFNAPNGGAQMHHDVERGHEGVVFAQLSGSTFWLALAKPKLLDEILSFLEMTAPELWPELRTLATSREALSSYLEEADHELAEQLIDQTPEFFRHLIERGYAQLLQPGDVLLMPQADLDTCVWHSVIGLGDKAGEALSFALKKA